MGRAGLIQPKERLRLLPNPLRHPKSPELCVAGSFTLKDAGTFKKATILQVVMGRPRRRREEVKLILKALKAFGLKIHPAFFVLIPVAIIAIVKFVKSRKAKAEPAEEADPADTARALALARLKRWPPLSFDLTHS